MCTLKNSLALENQYAAHTTRVGNGGSILPLEINKEKDLLMLEYLHKETVSGNFFLMGIIPSDIKIG